MVHSLVLTAHERASAAGLTHSTNRSLESADFSDLVAVSTGDSSSLDELQWRDSQAEAPRLDTVSFA